MTMYPSGKARRKDPHNFPECISDQDFRGWAPSPGKLQKLLQKAEYNALSKAPIFEGNFLQVTKRGECAGIHNHPNIVVMGILASRPSLLLPDLMIIAREKANAGTKHQKSKELEITRLIPLEGVEIFVHDLEERRLKVQIAPGQKYYLQLYAPGRDENFLFERWLRLLYLLHVASGKISALPSFTSKESGLHTIWKTASLHAVPKKQHWLPAIMEKGSAGQLKEKVQKASSAGEKPTSTQSAIASKQKSLKTGISGYSSYSSQGLLRIPTSERCTYTDQSQYSVPKILSQSASKKPERPQTSPSSSRRPRSPKQSQSKQAAPHSSPQSRASVGKGPSQAFITSQAAGRSRTDNRINTGGSSQTRSAGHPYVAEGVPTPVPSSESEPTPVKLQKSQKSSALVQTTGKTLTKEQSPKPHGDKEPATKSPSRSPGPMEPLRPPSRRREGAASRGLSPKHSQSVSRSVSIGAPSAGQPTRSRTLVAAAPETGAESIAPGSARPASRETQVTSEKRGASLAPSELESRGRSSASRSRTANVASREPSTAPSSRPQASSSPTTEWARSASQSPSRKRKEVGVEVRRTTASVAVGPSQSGWKTVAVGPSRLGSLILNRSQKQASTTQKQSEAETKPRVVKSKEPSRSKSESRNKLKLALSAAKQKSSVSFVTLFSILSTSLEKMKHSKSKDDNKHVAVKPSKRVTISGVIGPSGKNVLQDMEEEWNPEGAAALNSGTRTSAMMGMETEDPPPSQSRSSMGKGAPEAKTPAAGGGTLEAAGCLRPGSQIAAKELAAASMTSQEPGKIRHTGQPSTSHLGNRDVAKTPVATFKASEKSKTSVAPSKPGTNAPQSKMPSPRPSKKISATRGGSSPRPSKKLSPTKGAPSPKPTRGATRKTDKASRLPQTKIPVGMRPSMVDTVTMAAAPSDPDNRSRAWEQGKPRGTSPQRRGMADGQRSSSQPTAASGPSPKSRVLVGVGRSVTETKSRGVGRSATHTFSEAAGPSVPASSPPKSHVPGSEAAGLSRQVSKARLRSPVNRAPKPQRLDVVKLEDKTVDETRKSQKPRKAAVPSGPSHHE